MEKLRTIRRCGRNDEYLFVDGALLRLSDLDCLEVTKPRKSGTSVPSQRNERGRTVTRARLSKEGHLFRMTLPKFASMERLSTTARFGAVIFMR